MFVDQSTKRVKLGLLVNAIVDQNEVKPDDAKVKDMIEEMSSTYEDPEQVKNFYYSNEQQLNQIQGIVLEDQIVELVLSSAQSTEKKVTYEEAVRRSEPSLPEHADEIALTESLAVEAEDENSKSSVDAIQSELKDGDLDEIQEK